MDTKDDMIEEIKDEEEITPDKMVENIIEEVPLEQKEESASPIPVLESEPKVEENKEKTEEQTVEETKKEEDLNQDAKEEQKEEKDENDSSNESGKLSKKSKVILITILSILLFLDVLALVIYIIGIDKVLGFIK